MKKITLFILLALCLILNPAIGLSKMRTINKVRAGTPPFEIVKKILKANGTALKNGYSANLSNFAPYMTWLSSPDARIQPQLILPKPAGMIYTCRNFGAQLELSTGPIDYGVRHLLTPALMITLDSDNQAIRFFTEGYKNLPLSIRRDLDHLHLALAKDNPKAPMAERIIANVEANIDFQVDQAVARYDDRVRNGRLVVIGSVVDFDNIYKRGAGRLIIININGERDNAKLRSMSIMNSIDPKLRKLSVGREKPKKKKKLIKE